MRAYLRLKMDRPIEVDKHYISPGGYAMVTDDGTSYSFDFNESCGNVMESDNTVVEFNLKDEELYEIVTADKTVIDDISSSPSKDCFIQRFHNAIPNVASFSEFYVYTGEADEPEINVSRVEAFQLEYTIASGLLPTNTEFVTFEHIAENCVRATFSDKLLSAISNY